MVLLHYKKTDHNQFLHQAPGTTVVREIVEQLAEINNMRIQVDILACSIQQLATHGPLKPEEIRGLDLEDRDLIDNALIIADPEKKKWGQFKKPEGDQRFNEDKTRYRTGVIKSENLTNMMIETSIKAKKLVSYKRAEIKQIIDIKELYQIMEELKAALRIAYPNYEGLGQWEPARQIAEDSYNFTQINTDQTDYLDPKKSVMWWAGKELHPDKPLNSYIGKNQKTKIIVKLTRLGSGAPVRQAAIDEQTKIKMMSMYHKKQEEWKKIESNNQQDFAHSSWANPNNLKNYLTTGGQQVKWKPSK